MDPEEGTTGKRSPEWAFMRRLTIRKPDVGLYLDRWRLIATPWFGIYLHHIAAPDNDAGPHDHPWNFRTLVLRGGYQENFYPTPHVFPPGATQTDFGREQVWRRWSWHGMTTDQAHRITHLFGDTWTLVFVGRRRKTWGFFVDGAWLSWDEYEQK